MSFFKPTPIIAVHEGKFHADDVFACAALMLVLGGRAKIVRTRDPNCIAAATYAIDVGGVYDPAQNRFDHHMPEGAGVRDNGIPYAAFGLVWKEFGAAISGSPEIAARVEQKLVAPIDADDNGVSLVQSTNPIAPYGLHNFLYTYRPTWKEDPETYDRSFGEVVAIAKRIIEREVTIARDSLLAVTLVESAYQKAPDKRVIELDGAYPYQETLQAHSEPLYVVSPRSADTKWKVEAVRVNPNGFESRKPLPESWAGLRDGELAKVSGVPGAVFCHRNLFLAVAETREAAIALAKLAV